MKLKYMFLLISIFSYVKSSSSPLNQLFQTASRFLTLGQNRLDQEKENQEILNDSYDFIVVGAGSAGCALAARLSENPNWKVLLIEAGGSENFAMDIPMMVHFLQGYDINWKFKTEPSKTACLAMNNNQCNWPRGKVMGGSSVLNYMVYTRGHPQDYDNWAALGNDGWDFQNVSHYFRKLENNVVPDSTPNNYHGKNGPITVSYLNFQSDSAKAFVAAGIESGYPYTDYNGPNQVGFSFLQATIENGIRKSTNVGYLYPVRNRKNLHVRKNSRVTKILIDENKNTYGVQFYSNRKFYTVKASKEVILSAGALQSPQLLMLSGIGPKKHLRANGIKPIVNLAVGYNLMDHTAPGALTFIVNSTSIGLNTYRLMDLKVIDKYVNELNGPISSPGIESIAFIETDKSYYDPNGYPDLEYLQLGGSLNSDPVFRRNFGIRDEIYNEMFAPLESTESNTFMVFPMVMRPKSKGRIKLRSDNPFDSPAILPNYFSDRYDIDIAIRGIRRLIELGNTQALQKLNAKFLKTPVPGCKHYEFDSDDYWECYTRHFTLTIYHHCGTAKMGPESDKHAVVDSHLRVYGVKGLRVVDASIMPEIITGHTNAPVIMIAEKAADLIKKPRYFDHYDFLIVGSGAGGCVLANRLTENEKWNVLLIEAGKVETPVQDIPVLAAYMQSTAYNWGYIAEAQPYSCLGMDEHRCGFPRGKAVGGTSVINYMIYNRGHKNDFDRWSAVGNRGWSWNEVLPYFIKSERSTLEDLKNSPHHGKHGLLNVEYNRHRTVLAELFVKANKLLGASEVDYNSGRQLGVSFLQANTLNGKRHSAYKAFIEPIINRHNLHLMINTHVTKILIDPQTKIAYGVELIRNRKRYRINARKEVILASGTFQSPQLLMLSGIGPKEQLKRIQIPLIHDLPVGKIMYDHLTHLGMVFIVNTTGVSLNAERALQPRSAIEFLNGRGILTVPGGVEALSFIKTKNSDFRGKDVPDVELIFTAGSFHSDEGTGIRKGMRVNDNIYNRVYKQLEATTIDSFSIVQMLFHPKSVGYLELKSSNPFHWPKFYTNFLKDPDDIETILEGIKFTLKLVNTPPFKSVGARLHSVPIPNCAHIHFASDDYWRCTIRTLATTLHHQVSTCKMGPISDRTAVVSPELRVHGIQNLRIADTSIIPEAPTSHTNAMSFMIVNPCHVHCSSDDSNYHDFVNRTKRQSIASAPDFFLFRSPLNSVEEYRYFEQYDFIIAGSGPGGCALANRLTENSKWNVLLIEAGDVESPLQSIPVTAPYMVFSKYNWGREAKRCATPRGKALGGSSVIYFLMHTRGNPRDFDRWSEAGNYGWSFNEVLPYFIKSERANIGKYSNSPFHNRNGLWGVSFNTERTPLVKAFIKANKLLGLPEIDYNSDRQLGVSYVQANTLNGQRHSAYKAFIEPILHRQNLHIMVNTRVTKILIDPETKSAYGVEYHRNNKNYRVRTKKEVILSSGTFHTPQLLTLSGIGKKQHLNKLKIPVINELPGVGENMHDHYAFAELMFITNKTRDGFMTYLTNFFQYFNGRGLLTLPSGTEAFSFIKVPTTNSYGPSVPDIELIFSPGGVHFDRGFGITYGGRMRKDLYDAVYKPLENSENDVFLISLMLFHPKSIGRIEIPSANPFSDPRIYENMFEDSSDIEALLYGIKYVLKLIKQEPFKSLGARLNPNKLPICAHLHFASDNYFRCVIRAMTFSIQHQVGTSKMGPRSDPSAVVSPELKVHGMKNLRIVDTSIVPEAPTAHTNAISVMIGEKAADLIKRDWYKQ
ncbi:hypothetical protein PVAND_002984 [Polypedilum vanderplanki]|uniref:Glucose-methanol-choline oxidoreductase N-terminal domain-containing protein n=1 Tax=Polypedilum vanderplanki TaxID=319348 RepID=A0A9J6BT60_POLVA|nr:hypothetical protein PVAND_002984 [Polypedilum vanderplanki]